MAAAPRTIGFVLYPGCTLLDFAGATQIFSLAGFKCVWLAKKDEPVTTTENVAVVPKATFAKAPHLDIVFVPGGGGAVATAMQDDTTVGFVRDAGTAAQFAGSICTGAFIVAAAGLFDGREATTYWSQLNNLRLFPKVHVAECYPRWVIDGNRFSGGGISSSLDLALELVNRIRGPEASQRAQLMAQYAPQPPFDAGDPSQAPPELTKAVRKGQEPFTKEIREATLKVVG